MAVLASFPPTVTATVVCCCAMIAAFAMVSWLKARAAAKAAATAEIDARLKGLYRTVELRGATPDLARVLDGVEASEGGRTP